MSDSGPRNYFPISLPEKIPEGKLPFDLYIHYQDQYLRFKEANAPVENEMWLKLKKQKISQLYVLSDSIKAYQKYMKSLFDLAISSSDSMTGKERMGIMTLAAISSAKTMASNPNDKVAFTQTRQVSGGLIKMLREDPDLLETLIKADLKEDLLFLHSKNVAALTIGLATKAKTKSNTIEFLALAGLMHDIGISHMPKDQQDIFYLPQENVNQDVYNKYLKHGKNLELILENSDFIPKIVADLISCHEQDLSTNSKLNIFGQMLSMADKFDKMATIYGMGPAKAYENAKKQFIGRYDLTLIKLLGVVLKEGKLI